MAEYRTPAGVVIRTSDVAARSVGFKPVEPKKKPARRKADAGDDESDK